jgi:tryptophan synthase alpha chain
MNRINHLFSSKEKDLLSIYFCAGHPTLEGTAEVIKTLQDNGVKMVEIGIPFSDPMADGVVIQNAATQALRNGMSLKVLFEQLKDIRKTVTIPLVLMGYLNPIMQFGFEHFCKQCTECGVDGMIIPDLPFKDYQEHYRLLQSDTTCASLCLLPPKQAKRECGKLMSIPMALFTWFHLLPLPEHNKTLIFRSVITLRELKK